MMEQLTREQRRAEELLRGPLDYTNALDYARQQQQRYDELARGAYFETSSLLSDILGARPLDAAFARVAGLLDARESVRLEELTAGYGPRFVDLEKALGPTMPQPTYMAWSEHFQAAIRPDPLVSGAGMDEAVWPDAGESLGADQACMWPP